MGTETTVERFKERQKVIFQGKVYDFGYYSTRKDYCILYKEGETNMQDSVSVPIYNVSPASPTRAAEWPVTPDYHAGYQEGFAEGIKHAQEFIEKQSRPSVVIDAADALANVRAALNAAVSEGQ